MLLSHFSKFFNAFFISFFFVSVYALFLIIRLCYISVVYHKLSDVTNYQMSQISRCHKLDSCHCLAGAVSTYFLTLRSSGGVVSIARAIPIRSASRSYGSEVRPKPIAPCAHSSSVEKIAIPIASHSIVRKPGRRFSLRHRSKIITAVSPPIMQACTTLTAPANNSTWILPVGSGDNVNQHTARNINTEGQ